MNWKKIATILGIIISAVVISTFGYKGFCYFASAESVVIVNEKVTALSVEFQISRLVLFRDKIQERIWTLEDRIRNTPWDTEARPELRRLKLQLQDIDRQLQNLMRKGG